MEYIGGGSLDEYIRKNGGLSERESLEFILQIGDALSVMHRDRMLHLDLKPQNVMRRADGELVLIDFGLSKHFDENGEPESSTRIGFGTRGYAPMEQANYKRGSGFPATLDIYALGATLFKTLVGVTPPEASEVFNEGFPEAEMRECGVGDDLIRLTSWAMEPMKAKRPQSVDEFLAEARRLLPLVSEGTVRQQTSFHYSEKYETCGVFRLRWAGGFSEHGKNLIRELVRNMKQIGYKEQLLDGESMVNTLYSLGGDTWRYVYPLAQSAQKSIPVILRVIRQLEEWTGVPFRMAGRDELVETGYVPVRDAFFKGTLCFSMPSVLVCRVPDDGEPYPAGYEFWRDVDIQRLTPLDTFDFQLVCDRPAPVYSEHYFDIPYTQRDFDEIRPVGFSLYKVRNGNRWNITSPQTPMSQFLPEDYDHISNINVHTIPSGGPGPRSYLGIEARKGDRTYYYEALV